MYPSLEDYPLYKYLKQFSPSKSTPGESKHLIFNSSLGAISAKNGAFGFSAIFLSSVSPSLILASVEFSA